MMLLDTLESAKVCPQSLQTVSEKKKFIKYCVLPRSAQSRVTPRQTIFVLSARRQRFLTARTLQKDIQAATGIRVSTYTIRNRLHQTDSHKNSRSCDPSKSPSASSSPEQSRTGTAGELHTRGVMLSPVRNPCLVWT